MSTTLSRCTIPGLSVQLANGGRTFSVGELVDLDALAAPDLTWREALGRYADTFEPVGDDAPTDQEEAGE